MSSAPKWMSARLEKNLPTASKKLEMSSPSEARGTRSSLGGRRLEPQGQPDRRVGQRRGDQVRLERHARDRGHADASAPRPRAPRPARSASPRARRTPRARPRAPPRRRRMRRAPAWGGRPPPRSRAPRSAVSPAERRPLSTKLRGEFETSPTGTPAARRALSRSTAPGHRLDAGGDLLEHQLVQLGLEPCARDAELALELGRRHRPRRPDQSRACGPCVK